MRTHHFETVSQERKVKKEDENMSKERNFRIFLTNLAKYNDGDLVGEWLDLPMDEEELTKALDRIAPVHKWDGERDEMFITDYENSYDYKVEEYDDLDQLNEIAEELDDLTDDEADVYVALANDDHEERINIIKKGDYIFYHDCDDMSDVAERYLKETGMFDEIPEWAQDYFDFKQYGELLKSDGTFYGAGDGYVEVIGR